MTKVSRFYQIYANWAGFYALWLLILAVVPSLVVARLDLMWNLGHSCALTYPILTCLRVLNEVCAIYFVNVNAYREVFTRRFARI